jgi:AcrR family transcriptional regulator
MATKSPTPNPSRAERTRRAILDATRGILAEEGVGHLTVEGVATRAGVAKTSIYRRYRGKDELALAALIDMVETVTATPDLGDTREEIRAFVAAVIDILSSTVMGGVMRGIVSDLATDPDLGAAFREQVVALRMAEVRRLVDRGVARGDLRPGADPELAHELLFGPVYYRLLLSGKPLDHARAERLTDAAIAALRAS